MPEEFSEADKIKILLWCDRHCCLCRKPCGIDIVIHHIEQKGKKTSDIDNAIPLCFECHGKIESYNPEHPWGTKYKVREIKARRNQIYDSYTRHLVPPIHFRITQMIGNNPRNRREIPAVGFNLSHLGNSNPVKARVETAIFLAGKPLGPIGSRYYNGEITWNLNPRLITLGNFNLPQECEKTDKKLTIEVKVVIIDIYEREHELYPVCFTFIPKKNSWFLEPTAYSELARTRESN